MSLYYYLVIFTASLSGYVESLVPVIDKKNFIKSILARDYCTISQDLYIKDLKKFNKDLKDLIIVDNNPISYALNKDNGIPILTWTDDPNDNELIKLIPLLKYLSKVDDVRPIIHQIINKDDGKLKIDAVSQLLNNENNLSNQSNEVKIDNINNDLNNPNIINENNSRDLINKENIIIIQNDICNDQIESIESNNINENINLNIDNQSNIANNDIYNNIVAIPNNNLDNDINIDNNILIIPDDNFIYVNYLDNNMNTIPNNNFINLNY